MIVIGVDAHRDSHTAAAVDANTAVLIQDRTVPARPAGNNELLTWAKAVDEERLWALEDSRNMTGGLERLLLMAGEQVRRVPPKLMASQRKSARTYGKSDPIDALAVARAAIREPNLPSARMPGPELEIKLLADHRDDLVEEGTRHQRRLRWHLHELDPELQPGARSLGSRENLERIGRRLAVLPQSARVRICRELIRRIRELHRRAAELKRQLHELVKRHCSALLELCGCGTLMAARILAEIEDIGRFTNERQLAAYAGVAPLDASSGRQQRHRLNRTGNRRLNRALHIIAVTQIRVHQPAREHMTKRTSEGKSTRETLRALKRFIARRLFRILTQTAAHKPPATPGHAPLGCIT